jgi:hypothetical protein
MNSVDVPTATGHDSVPDTCAPLAFRVGIVGHRDLADYAAGAIEAAAARVLTDIEVAAAELADKIAGHRTAGKPPMVLVSPLAEGADRIGARVALRRGWRLLVPLPFTKATYEEDFPDSVSDFRDLLAAAAAGGEIVELHGSRDAPEEAYLAVGHFVLRHCELVVAIWDGEPARGVGGTGEIVADAGERGIPIVHIDTQPPHRISLILPAAPGGTLDYSADLLASAIASAPTATGFASGEAKRGADAK